jgi:hypothetical protein
LCFSCISFSTFQAFPATREDSNNRKRPVNAMAYAPVSSVENLGTADSESMNRELSEQPIVIAELIQVELNDNIDHSSDEVVEYTFAHKV